jgi:hypothetical protein
MKRMSWSGSRGGALIVWLMFCAMMPAFAAETEGGHPLALDVMVKKDGLSQISTQMLVVVGNEAGMMLTAKDGTAYKIEAHPRYVLDAGGARTVYVETKLFEQQGDQLVLIASPELMAPLNNPASVEVSSPPGRDRGTLNIKFSLASVDSADAWLKASEMKRRALFPVQPMQTCTPCHDGQQMCCTNACCTSGGCGTVCDGRHP